MAQENVEIKSYSVSRMTNYSDVRAVIWLTDQSDQWFARLAFHETNVPKKLTVQNYGGSMGEILWVYYPIEAFPDALDILRNEKPVSLTFEKTSGYARITTGLEPVGEGEDAA